MKRKREREKKETSRPVWDDEAKKNERQGSLYARPSVLFESFVMNMFFFHG